MKTIITFITMLVLAGCTTGPQVSKTKYRMACPECGNVVIACPCDELCWGNYAVEGGFKSQCRLSFICPACGAKFTANYEKFVKGPVVVEPVQPVPVGLPLPAATPATPTMFMEGLLKATARDVEWIKNSTRQVIGMLWANGFTNTAFELPPLPSELPPAKP